MQDDIAEDRLQTRLNRATTNWCMQLWRYPQNILQLAHYVSTLSLPLSVVRPAVCPARQHRLARRANRAGHSPACWP